METQYKYLSLELTAREHKDLTRMKLNFSSLYGISFTWEEYIKQIAKAVNDKLGDLKLKHGNKE